MSSGCLIYVRTVLLVNNIFTVLLYPFAAYLGPISASLQFMRPTADMHNLFVTTKRDQILPCLHSSEVSKDHSFSYQIFICPISTYTPHITNVLALKYHYGIDGSLDSKQATLQYMVLMGRYTSTNTFVPLIS